MAPSESYKAFESEASGFEISPTGLDLRFDAKQRMIARAEGFAVREAYLLPWRRMLGPGALKYFTAGLKKCEESMVAAEQAAAHPAELQGGDDRRHRAEILLNLYARTVQHIVLRRLYFISAVAAVAAVIAAVAAVVVTVFK